eukprot:11064-Eustigmatos_ZCMA.PRE.1
MKKLGASDKQILTMVRNLVRHDASITLLHAALSSSNEYDVGQNPTICRSIHNLNSAALRVILLM